WIISECEKYKNDLPFRYSNETENWGRINGAAAYAMKSRAALYLASPLYNKDGDSQLWKDAAQAALDFINTNARQSNPYRLHTTPDNDINENYYDCFITNPVMNNEYILSRSVWTTLNIEIHMAPCGFAGAISSSGRINPTQNLVDSYETLDGLPIDKDPSYDEQNPYVNRDPRLEQTILHQGSIWGVGSEAREVDMNANADAEGGVGKDFTHANGGTATGYYSKKYVNNIPWDNTVTGARHACPIFRYAEVLLNAAEALNESGQTGEAVKYVDQVRARVGMPSYAGKSQDELRERIRNERRIELCFEDHRYYDSRRWKLFDENVSAAAEVSLPRYRQVFNLYAVQIRRGSSTFYNYGAPYGTVGYSRQSFISPKSYFWPIPYNELIKTGYEQTPGWEL
ncbi:MAG: RagB/SusD family nutrient uptake outer membrane protein, partial [Muribaculaceae bacterium]|nr:RagB/SusD family nutrient uptake outer membrane protein [Muribaculaceae bacterium]